MSKYEAVYFVGDNQAINRVRIDSSKTRNRGAFSGSLAALPETEILTEKRTKNGQTNRRNYTNFERNLAVMVIYLPVKFEFNLTNRFRVGVWKRKF